MNITVSFGLLPSYSFIRVVEDEFTKVRVTVPEGKRDTHDIIVSVSLS